MTFPTSKVPWNKGKLVGQKLPLKLEQIWAIRIRLEIAKNIRELAMFNMAIDCKLRSCDQVKLLVRDISRNGEVLDRAQVIQQKTSQPVQFEITKKTRESGWSCSLTVISGLLARPTRQADLGTLREKPGFGRTTRLYRDFQTDQ